jgi:ankyrin repeat protein
MQSGGSDFEAAVKAVISGDVEGLRSLLERDPGLVRSRSNRPHHATLLHYIAANGVEDERQKTPPNAVEIADLLLRSGSDPDALADMYDGRHTTMSMLVSSTPPADAGLQVQLVEKLAEYGGAVAPVGTGAWNSPLRTALAFGFGDAAEALVRLGAKVDSLPLAAGLGQLDPVRDLLPGASAEDRHRALAFAAQHGQTEVVRLLLDAGEDPNRYNPAGAHAHSTPLHQAALAGHEDTVRLMVERGARIDIRDKVYQATPLGWAMHGGRTEMENLLRAYGAAD